MLRLSVAVSKVLCNFQEICCDRIAFGCVEAEEPLGCHRCRPGCARRCAPGRPQPCGLRIHGGRDSVPHCQQEPDEARPSNLGDYRGDPPDTAETASGGPESDSGHLFRAKHRGVAPCSSLPSGGGFRVNRGYLVALLVPLWAEPFMLILSIPLPVLNALFVAIWRVFWCSMGRAVHSYVVITSASTWCFTWGMRVFLVPPLVFPSRAETMLHFEYVFAEWVYTLDDFNPVAKSSYNLDPFVLATSCICNMTVKSRTEPVSTAESIADTLQPISTNVVFISSIMCIETLV